MKFLEKLRKEEEKCMEDLFVKDFERSENNRKKLAKLKSNEHNNRNTDSPH